MAGRRFGVDDLWRLPRVGGPVPAPDGDRVLVPVTTYDEEKGDGTTRIWLVDAEGRRAPVALTTAEASSGQPSLSPDGDRVAFVRKPGGEGPTHPEVGQLHVMALDGGEAERVTDLPFSISGPQWLPCGRRIAFLSEVYEEAPTPDGSAERKKAEDEEQLDVHVTEDRLYRYWDHWLTTGRYRHLFVLDLETRELTDLTPQVFRHIGLFDPSSCFAVSPDGAEIAIEACRSNPPYEDLVWAVYTVRLPRRMKAGARVAKPKLVAPEHRQDSMAPAYSPDGRWLVYGIQRDPDFYADRVRLVALDRSSGTHHVLTEDWDFSAGGWSFGDDPGWLWLTAEVDGRNAVLKLNVPGAVRNPARCRPREVVRGGTFTAPRPGGDRVFAARSSLQEPPEVYCFGPTGRDLTRLTGFTDEVLREVEISEVEDVRFTGAEGDEVQMFLVYPPGEKVLGPRSRKKPRYPLVHLIHGGPHGVFGDVWHWRWSAQAFAAPGYLCALVNFHGSTSWGQDFAASILGRWGDQPFEDVVAATDVLVDRGLADPDRTAVTGGSYGGYLVSWITSQTDRFTCAINHAGVCDFQTQYASDVVHHRARSMGGEPWDRQEGMDRYNPMRHAAGFATPTLVIHGQKDYRVPYNQGLELYNVLRAKGVPARLVVYPGENHWILGQANSKHWYGEFLGWLRRWLGGKG